MHSQVRRHVCRTACRRVCGHVHTLVCRDARRRACKHMCRHAYRHACAHMCAHMCVHMPAGMGADMCVDRHLQGSVHCHMRGYMHLVLRPYHSGTQQRAYKRRRLMIILRSDFFSIGKPLFQHLFLHSLPFPENNAFSSTAASPQRSLQL